MGTNLIKMIEDIDCEKLNAGLQGDGLFVRLFTRLFEERDKMMSKRNINLSDASLSMYIMSMYDSINTLSILAERCRNKKELIKRIEQIFKEESEGVCLSTIHKAKGLENDNVYILCNSSMPSKLAKKEWEKRQERNIQYVAYTRAKQRMGFVSENEISPSGSISEPIAILNDLHNIELQLQRITGRKPTEDSTNIKLTEFRLKNVTKVDENVNNDNVVELTQEENDDKSTNNDDILLQLADFLKRDDGNIDKLKEFLNS
jgi:ATP-dependent exoDNAse (exonuclease V) beta subunit